MSADVSYLSTEILQQHAGPRTRTVDDHMFAVDSGLMRGRLSTCRLQLFTGPGLRPVAIATQHVSGEGTSLINAAECFGQAVWDRHCPDEAEPAIFIVRMLGVRNFEFKPVGFTVAEPGKIGDATFGTGLTGRKLEIMVGQHVDPDRGNRYAPAHPQPAARSGTHFAVLEVARLPLPDLRGDPPCMADASAPQVLPFGCCPYHAVDWLAVSALAVRALSQAWTHHGRGARGYDLRYTACRLIAAEARDDATIRWAASLMNAPIYPDLENGFYVNGRHRARAMIDAGVLDTVVELSSRS